MLTPHCWSLMALSLAFAALSQGNSPTVLSGNLVPLKAGGALALKNWTLFPCIRILVFLCILMILHICGDGIVCKSRNNFPFKLLQ